MEDGLPDSTSEYADWGTAAHFLAAVCLREELNPADDKGSYISVDPDTGETAYADEGILIDDDMIVCVRAYVHAIREYSCSAGSTLLVEQAVPISHITGEDGATGTADAIILTPDGKELQVHDLKTGRGVRVEAKDNEQLMLYALGALEVISLMQDPPETIRLVIHQPRVSSQPDEWDLPLASLEEWGLTASEKAAEAIMGLEGLTPARLTPGEKQCKWCKAKATCPAATQQVLNTVADDFVDLTKEVAPQLASATERIQNSDTAHLAEMLRQVDFIEDWCKAVRGRVESEMLSGNAVPGFKLVQGRAGPRKWSSEAEAEAAFKSMRLKKEEMYEFKLISPTKAEKLLAESPKRWERLQSLVTQSAGSLSVAPEDDKRPAVQVKDDLGDFEVLT